MISVSTGDSSLDKTVLALIRKCRIPEDTVLSVCSDVTSANTKADYVIVITSNNDYESCSRHKEYSKIFKENYCVLPRPFSFSAFEEIVSSFVSAKTDHASSDEVKLIYDSKKRKVSSGKSEVTLTPKEAELFEYFLENKGRPISREELRERLWSQTGNTNAPDVYVSYLRQKLKHLTGGGAIVNVRGEGYLLKY